MSLIIETTKSGTDRLGNCEVCSKHCSEVFKLKDTNNKGKGILKFGHEACLQRHGELLEVNPS